MVLRVCDDDGDDGPPHRCVKMELECVPQFRGRGRPKKVKPPSHHTTNAGSSSAQAPTVKPPTVPPKDINRKKPAASGEDLVVVCIV